MSIDPRTPVIVGVGLLAGGCDGHLLEVTINRPEARNSLHPMANDELDHVFDCYFADDDLWVPKA